MLIKVNNNAVNTWLESKIGQVFIARNISTQTVTFEIDYNGHIEIVTESSKLFTQIEHAKQLELFNCNVKNTNKIEPKLANAITRDVCRKLGV